MNGDVPSTVSFSYAIEVLGYEFLATGIEEMDSWDRVTNFVKTNFATNTLSLWDGVTGRLVTIPYPDFWEVV